MHRHLFFHIRHYELIKMSRRCFAMKEPIFILTEQRQDSNLEASDIIIQQAITAWLTKELRK